MSLILEALKKSEANRRLGEAPDLATPFATTPKRRGPLPVLFVLIALASAGGWWLLRTPPAADTNVAATPATGAAAPARTPAAAAAGRAPAAPAVASRSAAPAGTEEKAGGGFIALPPKQWAPNQRQAASGGAQGTPAQNKPTAPAPAATQQNAPPAPAATLAGSSAQKKTEAAGVADAVKQPATAPSAIAGGTGQKKAEPAAAAATAPPPATASPSVIAGGTGQQKAEPAPAASDKPVFVASGGGQKKAEPPVAPPTAVASAGAQKKAEPAAGVTPGSVVASGSGQEKARGDNVQNAANAATPSAPPYYELSFATRKDLPQLKLSMHVYAEEPLQRFVILNNSRLTEGDKQDELSVREIRPDGVVLEFHGQRFFYPRDGI